MCRRIPPAVCRPSGLSPHSSCLESTPGHEVQLARVGFARAPSVPFGAPFSRVGQSRPCVRLSPPLLEPPFTTPESPSGFHCPPPFRSSRFRFALHDVSLASDAFSLQRPKKLLVYCPGMCHIVTLYFREATVPSSLMRHSFPMLCFLTRKVFFRQKSIYNVV